jgi:hypothetical protein
MVMNFLRDEVEDMERGLAEEAAASIMRSEEPSQSSHSHGKGVTTIGTAGKLKSWFFSTVTANPETQPLLTTITRMPQHAYSGAHNANSNSFIATNLPSNFSNVNLCNQSMQSLNSAAEAPLSASVSSVKHKKSILKNLTLPCDKNNTEESNQPPCSDIKQELDVWRKAHNSVRDQSPDQKSVRKVLRKKVAVLESRLRKKLREERVSESDPSHQDNFLEHLAELERRYRIKNKPLLIKCAIVMTIVIVLFFLQGMPSVDLSLGWIAILGAVALLILADFEDLDSVIGRIEWSTLLFFAALFVVMEALTELKLLYFVGQMTQRAINSFHEDYRLFAAVNVILWVSAIASSFIDNIPFATVMVKILEDMARSPSVNLPLAPLTYALAFGACLGGNGTLIGASANVVCAGVAEQHGYKISFVDFFR